jgi:hypothetical protein
MQHIHPFLRFARLQCQGAGAPNQRALI